jgi:hypothetical protein
MKDPESTDELAAATGVDEHRSVRQAKREVRQRQRAAMRSLRPPRMTRWKRPLVGVALAAVALGSVAWYGWVYSPASFTPGEPLPKADAKQQRQLDKGLDPWEGTTAATWPSLTEVPKADAIDTYSRAEVQQALEATNAYLRASMLDPRVLYRGQVAPVLATLAHPATVRSAMGSTRTGKLWPQLATRFQPAEFTPVGDRVRLRGHMTPTIENGELAVDYSYAAVYALRSLSRPTLDPELVVVRHEGTMTFREGSSGMLGKPEATYWASASDHSICKQPWPQPAYTPVWYPDQLRANVRGATVGASHDLTNPDDSLRDFQDCFRNTGHL